MTARTQPRIGLLTSEYLPYRGGIGTYARDLAIAAAELGAAVTVWAPDYGKAPPRETDGLISIRRFSGSVHRGQNLPRKFLVAREAARAGYDILHAADWPFFLPLAFLGRLPGVRKLATIHGTEINHIKRPSRAIVYDRIPWAERFDALLCNSHFTRDLFLQKYPGTKARTAITLLGVSDFWLAGEADREKERASLGLTPADRVVITTGRLTHRKGQDRTLAALEALPPDLKARTVYLIVGPDIDADFVDTLKATVKGSSLRVKIMGELSDTAIRNLYAAADLFVLTGRQHGEKVEGFGLVFLEAGGSGLPSVATRTGGVPDAVIDGETGLLVEDYSIAAITAAVRRCLSDDAFRSGLSRHALAYARRMSWRACAARSYDLDDPTAGAAMPLDRALPDVRPNGA